MANHTIVKGNFTEYPKGVDTFTNRIADNWDGSNLSPTDNAFSSLKKQFMFKKDGINSKVTVNFLTVDNGWQFIQADRITIQSISKSNK